MNSHTANTHGIAIWKIILHQILRMHFAEEGLSKRREVSTDFPNALHSRASMLGANFLTSNQIPITPATDPFVILKMGHLCKSVKPTNSKNSLGIAAWMSIPSRPELSRGKFSCPKRSTTANSTISALQPIVLNKTIACRALQIGVRR